MTTLTGDDIKRLVGECKTPICDPRWWDELAEKINKEKNNERDKD